MQTANQVAPGASPAPVGATPLAQFFIPAAASLQERRPRTLKHDDTFAVFDHNGDALAGPGSPEGIFHKDTRHLSYLYLTISGMRPMLLSSTLRDDNASLTCDLTNPDVFDGAGRLVLAHDLIHLRRARFVWNGACFERLLVRNFDDKPQSISIEIDFAADFADIFEVRGTQRERRGKSHPAVVAADSVTLSYTGLDDLRRHTTLRFDPQPRPLSGERAVFTFELGAREARALFMEITCGQPSMAEPCIRRGFFPRSA
jgi:glycogen debranching enzyme